MGRHRCGRAARTGRSGRKQPLACYAARLEKLGIEYQLQLAQLALHLKRTGDLTRRASVAIPLSKLQGMRDEDLIAKAKEILTIADSTKDEEKAASRGVTPARIATLTAAHDNFDQMVNAPRKKIVNRSTLLREVETRVGGLLEDIADLDDLVVQFDGSDTGRRFIAAWDRARVIVDAGHGPKSGDEAPQQS